MFHVSWGGHVLHSPKHGGSCSLSSPHWVMFSKLCSPNQVMEGCRTHSVSALLLVDFVLEEAACYQLTGWWIE